jgi:glycosyltransferase involved in cell wall biosynthesis
MISVVINTKNREDGLYTALFSILEQSMKPKEILIYDDSDKPKHKNIWNLERFKYLQELADLYHIEIKYKKTNSVGQTVNHQRSQVEANSDYIYRLDDDESAHTMVLERLYSIISSNYKVGAVGPLVITPGNTGTTENNSQSINDTQDHSQRYFHTNEVQYEVDHLHSSYMYRKGIAGFPDKILHSCGICEETIHSHEMFRKGFKL